MTSKIKIILITTWVCRLLPGQTSIATVGPPDAAHPLTVVIGGSCLFNGTTMYTSPGFPAYSWGQHFLSPLIKTGPGKWVPASTSSSQSTETLSASGILTVTYNNTIGVYRSAMGTINLNTGAWEGNAVFDFGTCSGTQTGTAQLPITFQVGCAVTPLTKITDAAAITFEAAGGNIVDIADLTPDSQTSLACFQNSVNSVGGSITLSSAYRPAAYQAHLREVWSKWQDLESNTDTVCATIKTTVQGEFQKHKLLGTQQPAAVSAHTQGRAFDARVTIPPNVFLPPLIQPVDQDLLASACGLRRTVPKTDPVHFVH